MRRFWCILLSVSLIFCFTVPAFATPWSGTQATTVTESVVSMDTKLSNIYTALQVIYNYISNNGSGIREGIYSLYLNSNTTNERLQYLLNIGYSISGYLEPLAGDGKNVAQQLLDIRQNQLSIGGQVGDVSSKLVTTNQSLSNIDTNITGIRNTLSSFNITWTTLPQYSFVGLSTDNVNFSKENMSGDIVYVKFTCSLSQTYDIILKLNLPIVPNNMEYLDYIEPIFTNANAKLLLINYNPFNTEFYIHLNDTTSFTGCTFAFHMKDGSTVQQRIRYASSNGTGNYIGGNRGVPYNSLLNTLYTIKDSELLVEQTDAIRSLANEFNGTNGIIQDDSDTIIIVDFDDDTGEDVSDFITTVKNFFDTGVSIGELTIALNQFSNMPWFTDLNTYNTVNDQGAYFKDLY